jgi:hypothetical protein
MAKCMHKVVLQNTKITVQDHVFFDWSADEVTIIDNQEWINVHAYMIQNWICILILLTLKWVKVRATTKKTLLLSCKI